MNPNAEMTKYALKKLSGVEHVSEPLKTLVLLGLISETKYSGISKYRINLDDKRVKAIKEFFEKTYYLNKF